ncbi:translocation/assembly module TamB domain-containing protein [Marinobacter sp. BGYM27]|uniref:translocation/assembly module TamB domain-containing protein n=1 Tax=Marinobacter sp. BGYM27 TaxID=2975597 RepID=UPI0021A86D8B|nr:translocation/assembly module TamB domain-containing protein [Marinobacter sp. BGYM27]MDG5498569.1 translocation/assembly module TamB [Marinobacter sp. BGYM27]
MKRWLLWTLAAVLMLIVLVLTALAVMLRSDAGTRWVLEQIPGLTLTGDSGSLVGHWQAQHVRWQGYGVIAEVDQPDFEWSPGCLFKGVVCVDRLLVERIDITLAPSEAPADDQPFQLPSIDIPLGIAVGDVRLGPLSVNESEIWQSFTLEVEASGAAWRIKDFNAVFGDVEVGAEGTLETRGDWPLNLNVDVSLPSPDAEKQWLLDLNLAGSAHDLRIQGESSGYLDASLNGVTRPFLPGLPAKAHVTSDAFTPSAALPDTLTIKQWVLDLDGSLDDGFEVKSQAELPGTTGAVPVNLTGHVTTERATGIELSLTGPASTASSPQTVTANADVAWADGFNVDGSLKLVAFPWHVLIPDMAPPPVTLKTLNGDFSYDGNAYSVSVSGDADGPAGDTRFAAKADGDAEQVRVSDIEIDTGGGGLSGEATIDYATTVRWDAAVKLEQFDPSFWMPEIEATLSGAINSKGALPDSGPQVTADWDLKGDWKQQDASTRGKLASDGGGWNLEALSVSVGENKVSGSGRWADQLEGKLALSLPELGQLWPGISGTLKGDVAVSGTPDKPGGKVSLSGDSLVLQGSTIDQISLQGALARGETINLTASAKGVKAGDQLIGDVDAGLKGTRKAHQLDLKLVNPEVTVNLGFAGALADIWSGAISNGEVRTGDQVWQLESAAELEYTGAGELTLGEHCWRWQTSSLCASDQALLPDQKINYTIKNFPMSALAALWPENFRWQANLDGEIDLEMNEQGPDGKIRLDVGPGSFDIQQVEGWRSITYQTLTAEMDLTPKQAKLGVKLSGEQLGTMAINLKVDPSTDEKRIDGDYQLDDLKLGIIEPFAQIETIEGVISGRGRLTGPLMEPSVEGTLSLADGEVVDERIPMPFHDVFADVEFKGQQADIKGRWQSNERSKGTLTGNVDWRTGVPKVAVAVKGDRMPLVYEPYARLEMSPDIKLTVDGKKVSVEGKIDVPRGDVEVRELPPQAVSVSDDEVIVGVDAEEAEALELMMDVTVTVGADKVTFKGFGVTGNLKGELRIGNNLDTRGVLKLVDGNYKAYGQELELRRARLLFVGPVSEPYLDIEAVRRVDAVIAGIRLKGPADEPQAEVFSEPPMSQQEALSYVVLGRPLKNSGDQSQVGAAALSLGLARTNDLTRGIGEVFGVKDLTLEAEGSGDEASVVASGYLTEDLSVRYGVGVFEPVTTVALRYDLGRYFYLEAASGLAASLDIFYTRDF